MAKRSKGYLIVAIGPSNKRGKKSRTVREREGKGHCCHCGMFKTLFSYADDGVIACSKACWTTYVLMQRHGVRPPTAAQVSQQNAEMLERAKARAAQKAGSNDPNPDSSKPVLHLVEHAS